MNTYEWKEDPQQPLTCYDYVTGKSIPYGYVLNLRIRGDNKWLARTSFVEVDAKYDTLEEAKAVVEALVAMHNN